MRERYDAGVLLVGGPLRSGMAGMALLEVADLEEAHAFATADPWEERLVTPADDGGPASWLHMLKRRPPPKRLDRPKTTRRQRMRRTG